MALSLVNNVSALTAQNNLTRTNNNLSKSLERLSTGLKVNRGADGPAALVISEQQRAQISGLRTAIDNTNKAVSVVQTAEGALNEVNGLLGKVRALALDSANTGVNDSNALAANQAEITNSIDTITRIANTTKFGTKNLLNGQAGATASITGANNSGIGTLTAGTSAPAGTVAVAITTQGTGGSITAATVGTGTLSAAGSVTLSGGGLASGQNLTVALAAGDNTSAAVSKIQSALDNSSAIGGGAGKFVVDTDAGAIRIRSNVLGSSAVTVSSDSAGTAGVTGFAAAGQTGTAGANLVATVGGQSTTVSAGSDGLNNKVNFGGAEGLTFSVNVVNGSTAGVSSTNVTTNDQSLTFQIGANANETAKLSIDKVTADRLGTGVSGSSAANLSAINVTTAQGAQDAIRVVDKAINDVSNLRGKLGAFQANTLESNSNNLRATLENTVSAESVIRDTDFASEIANFTKAQTQLQAGSTVLGNANQITQLVAGLLRG
jgi:flagellin